MARRVNTKFLIILTLVVGGGGVAALVATKFLLKPNPDALVQQSDEALAAGDLDEGARFLQRAIGARPGDPTLRVRLGDVWLQQSRTDSDAPRRAMQAWNSALEVDPTHQPALDRLLTMFRQIVASSPESSNFAELRRLAERAVALQPDNYEIQGVIHQTIIEPAVAHGYPTSRETLEQAVAGMMELMEKDPAGSLYPYWVARARLYQAASEGETIRQRLRDETLALFDKALQRQPENAAMHWRAAQIHRMASAFERDKASRDARLERARELAMRALELAREDDPHYTEMHVQAAELTVLAGNYEGAVEIMRKLAAARPDDPEARLYLAQTLGRDPQHRAEAVALLETPLPERQITPATAVRNFELPTQVLLLELRIGRLGEITDAAQKQQAMQQIESLMTDLTRRLGETPRLLRLRGQLLLAQNKPVPAIQALEQARAIMQHEGLPTDYELLFTLARSYIQQGQTGLAEGLLSEILRAHPGQDLPRLLLADLLLQRNDITGAEYQLRQLEEHGANPAQLQRLRLAIANARADKESVAREFDAMPEETAPQMAVKAQLAAATGNRPEAIRLLEKARQAQPGLINPQALAVLYLAENQREKAVAVIRDGLQADPDNRVLRLLDEQLKIENPTPEQVMEARRRVAGTIEDEFDRAVTLFDIERDSGNADAALMHLRRAIELRPDNIALKNQLFAFHLQQRDWAAAEKMADELGRANTDQAEGRLYRYQLALARGQLERAVEIANELVNRLPQFAQSHLALAQARQRQQQYALAIESYNRVLERQRTNMEAYRGLIACYEALQQYDQMLRTIEQAQQIRPNDPFFAEAKLQHAERYGNPADALPAREAAVKQNPDNLSAVAQLGQVYQASARYAAQRGDESGAKAAMEKARATFAAALNKWPDELSIYAALASTQVALQDLPGAEQTLRQVFERDAWKDKPQPHQLLAEFFARIGRIADAKVEMRQAMLKAHGDVDVRLQLAAFLARSGDVDAALEELAAAGDDPRVQGQRIEILLGSGRLKEAEAALNQAITTHPDSAILKAQLAALMLATERPADALAAAEDALARDANNALALLTKGRVQLLKGEAEAAIQTLTLVRELAPNNIDARLALAEAHRRLGNTGGAITELEAAVEAQPLNKGLRLQLLQALASARPPRWLEAETLLRQTRQMPQFAQDPDWMLAEATMWRSRGQHNRALAAVQEAKKLLPDNPVVLSSYFDTLLAARQFKQVLDETRPLMEQEPVPAWIYQTRAIAHNGAGDPAAALAEFEKALATPEARQHAEVQAQLIAAMAREIGVRDAIRHMGDKIDTDPAWQLLALQLYQSGDMHDEAIGLLERMDESKLTEAQLRQYLRHAGMIYSSARPMPRAQQALDAYVKLLEIEPDAMDVLNNLACLLIDTMRPADPNRAFTYSQRAMDLMNQRGQIQPLIQDTHGWVMTHIPQRQVQGMNLLAEVVSRNPSFPEAYYHLGVAYLKQSEPRRAIPHLERARQMIDQMEPDRARQYTQLRSDVEAALAQAHQETAQASGGGT